VLPRQPPITFPCFPPAPPSTGEKQGGWVRYHFPISIWRRVRLRDIRGRGTEPFGNTTCLQYESSLNRKGTRRRQAAAR